MKKELVLAVIISILAVFYAGYRAHVASMTIDESGTFLNHVHKSVFDILTNSPEHKADGNNHILNTLLIKASIGLFGANSLSVRLPNVLALGLYLFFGIRILLLLGERPFFLLLGLSLLLLNPYQFDFFSLARGYGIAMSLMVASLFYWLLFLKEKRLGVLALAFSMAFLSVLSNFVWLNYFAGLLGCFTIWFAGNWIKEKRMPSTKFLIIAFCSTIILFVSIYTPLSRLNDIGLFTKGFWGNNDFWTDTFHHLFSKYVYAKTFFTERFLTNWLKNIIPLLLGILLLIAGYRQWYKRKIKLQYTFGLYILFLIIIISLSTIVQKLLFNTDYLINRTAVIYYPLLALGIIVLFAIELPKIAQWSKIFFPTLTLILFLHFYKAHQYGFFREWYFDEDTKSAMYDLSELVKEKEKVKLGTHWSLCQASNFYIKTNEDFNIQWVLWDVEISTDEKYDYHFIPFQFSELIDSNYVLVKKYRWNAIYEHRRMR